MTKKLVLILSGGMDSFTLLHHAISKNIEVVCVTFDYGQRHAKEIICAQQVCKELKINNLKIQIPNVDAIFANSALTDDQAEVPHGSYKSESMQSTIVPNRPEFLSNMNSAAQTCHTYPINVEAPFVDLTKGEIVKIGLTLGIDYSKTWTCYEGKERACGQCGSCNERLEAFALNNSIDPLLYKN